jgi:hypothetical protein
MLLVLEGERVIIFLGYPCKLVDFEFQEAVGSIPPSETFFLIFNFTTPICEI